MDLQVPLNRLKFGQDDGAGINARVAGRQHGIAELAANLHAQGQIENLIVKDAGNGFYSVANGNRRLAAFHMIHGADSSEPISCTLHDVDETRAFEMSLTTAITAEQLHPVDQYEAFARLEERGKTHEEIARDYGMTEREVEQALALGQLSPKIRESWRNGELKASTAKAFTLTDHKRQNEVLEQLRAEAGKDDRPLLDYDDDDVKDILQINQELGVLVEFVGVDAYVARGGKVTRDLFGVDHQVSDEKLARKMADEKLAGECERLVKSGWGFAVTRASVKNTYWNYSSLKAAEAKPTAEEQQHLEDLERATAGADGYDLPYFEMSAAQQKAFHERRALVDAIALRGFLPKAMAKAGCFVEIDECGFLKIEYGKVKPAQKEAAAKVEKEEQKEKKKSDAKAAKSAGAPAPEPRELSGALNDRLEAQLVAGTLDAIAACLETDALKSPLAQILGRLVCSQVKVNGSLVSCYSQGTREKLPAMREAMPAIIVNNAIAKRFDAEDYFGSAPKGFVIKAIAEAINPDEARKAAQGSKREIAEFATKNLKGTGWVPKELRTVHYAPPVVKGGVVVPIKTAPATKKKPAKPPVKRAAAAKKSVKKTSKKKR